MNSTWINIWLVISLVAFVYVIKQWFDYRKVAVKTKGYPATTGMTFIFLAFMTFTGVLSLSDRLLNALLSKIGFSAIDASKLNDNKWVLLVAFFVLAFAVVAILKRGTKNAQNSFVEKGVASIQAGGNSKVNVIQNFDSEQNPKLSNHFIEESQRKNKEIDKLKEKLEKNLSPEEKLHLSSKINQLEAEKKSLAEKLNALEQRLKEYSDVKVVEQANKRFKEKGIDAALEYLESIEFDKALAQSLENAKALLIKADFHAIKNQHQKAKESYLTSLQFKRYFDNTIAYANYLFDQNQFDGTIRQLSLLKLADTALTQRERARLEVNLADAYQKNNNFKKAEKAYDIALEITRALLKENPSAYQPDVAMTLNNLAALYNADNRLKDAEQAYDEALSIYRDLSKENPRAYQPNMAATLNNLANLYSDDNRLEEAEQAYNEALGIRRELSKENPSAYQPDVAMTLNNLAVLYRADNRLKNAEQAYDEALSIYRDLSKENLSAYQPYVAATLNNLANLYSVDNRLKEAEKAHNEALGIRRELSKENPSAYQPDVALTLNNLANLYSDDNRLEEAEQAYNEALGVYQDLSKENPNAYGIDLANSLVMGVDLLNQPKENLIEAKAVLLAFKGIPRADRLLSIIKKLEEEK